jgi:hypothetical protein
MKKILVLIILFCAGVCGQSLAKNDVRERIASNGNYVGLKEETYVDPEEPDAKWFHENTLLVRNDEAILDEVPVVINHGKKGYSASDGRFEFNGVKYAPAKVNKLALKRLLKLLSTESLEKPGTNP